MSQKISSSGEWDRILSGHSVVVADFYADWCGPCKMIAPTFESLATKFSKPGKIAFVKVDVDKHQDISSRYGVRAMPTFKIFHNGSNTETIQGANPPTLSSAVEKAVKLAGPGGGNSFSGHGHKLGGTPLVPTARSGGSARRLGGSASTPWNLNPIHLFTMLYNTFALYFVTLFSLDPYRTAENSGFNVNKVNNGNQPGQGRTLGGATTSAGARKPGGNTQKPKISTLADL